MKKAKTARPAPEFHIAVNLAATPGVGAPALQGTCIVSENPIPQVKLGSLPSPVLSPLERDTKLVHLQSCSARDPRPGRSVYISEARKSVLQTLSACATAGRVPSAHEILTWMDAEHPDLFSKHIDSYSEFEAFGIDDAFNIMETDALFLATFGNLGHDGATLLRQYTRDHFLVPLGLWMNKIESTAPLDESKARSIVSWLNDVEDVYCEDRQSMKVVKVEEVEVVEVVSGGGDSESSNDIEEVNVGQWETEF